MEAVASSGREHLLLFVRHGHALPNTQRSILQRTNPPLSSKGVRQVQDLAVALTPRLELTEENGGLVRLVSSPMQRTLETAAPTAAAAGHKLLVHGGIFEYTCKHA